MYTTDLIYKLLLHFTCYYTSATERCPGNSSICYDMGDIAAGRKAIILFGKQNIPLQGHRDDYTSVATKKGNFIAIL